MIPLVLRWQIGPYGETSWLVLDTSIQLMKRLEPDARFIVVHQGPRLTSLPGVEYYPQPDRRLEGHHHPSRFDITTQEVWFDNDHIMWALPDGWKDWRKRCHAVLVWKVDWSYYGWYHDKMNLPFDISSGMWGLPPGMVIPPAIWPDSPEGDDMGWIAYHLWHYPRHEVVTIEEVSCFQPGHVVLGPKWDHFGTHGVHFPGLNRGWNFEAVEAIDRIRKEHSLAGLH